MPSRPPNIRMVNMKKLIAMAAEKYDFDPAPIRINTGDRGNQNIKAREYSMTYDKRRPAFKRWCGPDWTFVSWPATGIESFEKTRVEIIKSSESAPLSGKVGWVGNINSATADAPEHKTRPLLKKIADENPDLMEVFHVFPPNPKNPIYQSMSELVRQYEILIDIGGNGYSGRLKYLLFSKRPMLVVERNYLEYFSEDLKPWYHYIPVQMNLSDLVEKTKWIIDNKKKSKEIAEKAFEFASENFTEEKILNSVFCVYKNL